MSKAKPRIAISFSGGRSSAAMLNLCLDLYSETHEILIVFANTGCEAEATLQFVDDADRNICKPRGYSVTWIEAVINGPGVGPTAKVVTFETAARNGEPFEDAIKKHGVFCSTHPNCTGRLKVEPFHSYLRGIGWKSRTYQTAIGIRGDERIRCSAKAEEQRIIYPLVEHGWRKRDVNEWCSKFDWDLKLPNDAHGNCTWCWKKSLRKLMTVAKTNPEYFEFPARMEREYGHITKGAEERKENRTFFRNWQSAEDILHLAETQHFTPYEDDKFDQFEFFEELMDEGGGCGDSCEIGADEKTLTTV